MIWKTRKHGDVMASFRPMTRQFPGAGGGRTHLWRKVL